VPDSPSPSRPPAESAPSPLVDLMLAQHPDHAHEEPYRLLFQRHRLARLLRTEPIRQLLELFQK
ncbi:MAG: hypothetical protein ACRDRT_14960, partial [Pseudonocardiaceae bacterium]